MKKSNLIVIIVLVGILLTTAGCNFHNGLPACDYQSGLLGIGDKFVYQGQEHPLNTNFVCGEDGQFVSSSVVSQPAPAQPAEPTNTSEPPAPKEVVPTTAPATKIPCNTIQVSTDGGTTWNDAGEELDTELGHRVTWTSRRTVVPAKAWNEKLSDAELKLVETTWVKVRFNACQTKAVLFAGGTKINTLKFEKGVLLQLDNQREIDVRNGELVLWFDQEHQDKDLERIVKEIKNGNFDIKSRLGLAVTDNLKDKLPADLMTGVQIVLIP